MKKIICILLLTVAVCAQSCFTAFGISAAAYTVINGDNGELIESSNGDTRLPMASTTKIMTALLLCEHGDFDREITVSADMLKVEGSSMGLLAGDKVTLHDLLYGMMLASGNDAANVTAITIGGSVGGFVEMMNKRAEEMGLKDTHFVTPSGLDADGHYTTAKELAIIAMNAMKNEEFAKAASSASAVLNYGNPPYRRSLSNHNRLLKYFDGAVGVKTGFTKKSGRCLVSAARRDGKLVIAVTLNDPNDWKDHEQLLESGLNAIHQTDYKYDGELRVPVINGKSNELKIELEPYTVNTVSDSEINGQIKLPKFIYAPVKSGDVIGEIEYFSGDTAVGKSDIISDCDIDIKTQKKMPLKEITLNFLTILKSIR